MKYQYSMVVNCNCRPDFMTPKIYQNTDIIKLPSLFDNKTFIEYQYYKSNICTTGQTIVKITHCQKCKLSEKSPILKKTYDVKKKKSCVIL
jgi:hypothetical protein